MQRDHGPPIQCERLSEAAGRLATMRPIDASRPTGSCIEEAATRLETRSGMAGGQAAQAFSADDHVTFAAVVDLPGNLS